jgi:hypothetical protein
MLLITRATTSGIFEGSVPLAGPSQQMSRDVRPGDNKQGVLARGFSFREIQMAGSSPLTTGHATTGFLGFNLSLQACVPRKAALKLENLARSGYFVYVSQSNSCNTHATPTMILVDNIGKPLEHNNAERFSA